MNVKTLEQIINENPAYKAGSLYNAAVRSIKDGPLRGKAIPLNRNDPQAKFMLPKAVTRTGREPSRAVTNFVILDPAAFDAWFEINKESIRTSRALGRNQVVMPRLEDIQKGHYTKEQLAMLADHVATRRYGSHRSGRRAAGGASDGGAARPAAKPAAGSRRKPGRPRNSA